MKGEANPGSDSSTVVREWRHGSFYFFWEMHTAKKIVLMLLRALNGTEYRSAFPWRSLVKH